ncbi:hypothetical protein ACFO26_01175 [Lactococcus nasutitermitis]|uniref:DUF4845 domain-containing protein n=1 Tax=Lactococcus nasutitermitis TaxID=1652957 RepID=A0ABV9JDR5_9LACT|nr:hypothetical protein [Lactococcus nasutitermitis]
MSLTLIIVLAVLAVLVVIILGIIILIPGMALFNKVSDEKYSADEKNLLTGTLTTAITGLEATGEVVTTIANESRKTMPAKIFTPNKDNVTAIEQNASVLIVDTKDGVAYVIPYQEMIF